MEKPTADSSADPPSGHKIKRKVPPLSLNTQANPIKKDEEQKNRGSHSYSPRKNQITPRSARSITASTVVNRQIEPELQSKEAALPNAAQQSSFCANIEVARKVRGVSSPFMTLCP